MTDEEFDALMAEFSTSSPTLLNSTGWKPSATAGRMRSKNSQHSTLASGSISVAAARNPSNLPIILIETLGRTDRKHGFTPIKWLFPKEEPIADSNRFPLQSHWRILPNLCTQHFLKPPAQGRYDAGHWSCLRVHRSYRQTARRATCAKYPRELKRLTMQCWCR